MTTLQSVPELDPHLIIETCPRCGAQTVIGRVEPHFAYGIGLCWGCAWFSRLGNLFSRMLRVAAAFAGLRPFGGYVEWTLFKNQRFIEPLTDSVVHKGDNA